MNSQTRISNPSLYLVSAWTSQSLSVLALIFKFRAYSLRWIKIFTPFASDNENHLSGRNPSLFFFFHLKLFTLLSKVEMASTGTEPIVQWIRNLKFCVSSPCFHAFCGTSCRSVFILHLLKLFCWSSVGLRLLFQCKCQDRKWTRWTKY